MRYIFITFLLLYCLVGGIIAQTDFRDGYIITNHGDTIRGLVDYRGDQRNMKLCTFKQEDLAEPVIYLPGSIRGYRFNEGKYYISKYIETESIKDTVFIEFLLKGISNLYFYNNNNYSAYFIESNDGRLLELKSEEVEIEENGKVYLKKDNRYLGLLMYAFEDCPEIRRDIERVEAGHKSLINITKKYHDYMCDDERCIVYEKEVPVFKLQLFPYVGFGLSTYQTNRSYLDSYDFDYSYSVIGGLGFNVSMPRMNEKLSFLANVQLYKDDFHGTYLDDRGYIKYNNDAFINTTRLSFDGGLQYTYPKGKFRPFISVALNRDWCLSQEAYIIKEANNSEIAVPRIEESIEHVDVNMFGCVGRVGGNYHFENFVAFIRLGYKYAIGYSHELVNVGVDVKHEITTLDFAVGIIL